MATATVARRKRARRFPANEITWDNYLWAVRTYGMKWSGHNLTWGRMVQACRQLRADAIEGRLMSELVDPEQIEEIVGARRHPRLHRGRADSTLRRVYILHSEECRSSGLDLRTCPYSIALDRGIRRRDWIEDAAVDLAIMDGRLVVAAVSS